MGGPRRSGRIGPSYLNAAAAETQVKYQCARRPEFEVRQVPAEGKEREERTGIPSRSWVTQIFKALLRERTGTAFLTRFYARTDFPFVHRLSGLSTFFDSYKDPPAFLFHPPPPCECGEFLVGVDDELMM